jgi:hypothetical protein
VSGAESAAAAAAQTASVAGSSGGGAFMRMRDMCAQMRSNPGKH